MARFAWRVVVAAGVLAWTAGCYTEDADPFDYFQPDQVLEVGITLAPADWDALRVQERSFFDSLVGAGCLDTPFDNPFTYFPATVTVDGLTLDNVGVRKKGFFGSVNPRKPSLKLSFDAFLPGQRLLGTERMTLNNAVSDPSFINQCLGYSLFAQAGVAASRCNFAHVTVNGEDFGIFVHVESVKKPMLKRNYASAEGHLYEGSISDFRMGWTGTFEQKTNRRAPVAPDFKIDPRPVDPSDILAVVDALGPGLAQPATLEREINLDNFLTFWGMELLVGHWDGYAGNANNFFAYRNPSDQRFHFMPWGIDNLFFNRDPLGMGMTTPPALTNGAIAHALYVSADGRARYEARVRELLDTSWNEADILAEIDRMEALLRPYLLPGDLARGFDARLTRARNFISSQRAGVLAALATPFTPPPMRNTFCFVPIGSAVGSFSGFFRETPPMNPFFGTTSTIMAEIGGVPVDLTGATFGAVSNPAQEDPTARASVAAVALMPDGILYGIVFQGPREMFVPGPALTVDWRTMSGFLVRIDTTVPMAVPEIVGLVGGTLTFTEAAATDGAPVAGTFNATLYENFLR